MVIGDVVSVALPEPGIYVTLYSKFPVIVSGCMKVRLIDLANDVPIRFRAGSIGTK